MQNAALNVVQHTPNYDALSKADQVQLRRAQIKLLEQAENIVEVDVPENYLPFLKTQEEFTPEYEAQIRVMTNPLGQHNSAYDPEEFAKMPVQDKLVKVWGWFHGKTGFSCMFRWASGRQDAHVILDSMFADEASIQRQQDTIKAFGPAIEKFKQEAANV